MASNTEKVYVRLLNEGTEVFRPTQAESMGAGVFRLHATDGYDPHNETWEFLPGVAVRCEMKRISSGDVLLAVEEMTDFKE